MRHLTVSGFGDFLGVHGNRLIVRNGDNVILETALSRLRTIRIDKSVSLSSNLILACAARGIRIYFLDWKGVGVVEVSGGQARFGTAPRQVGFVLAVARHCVRDRTQVVEERRSVRRLRRRQTSGGQEVVCVEFYSRRQEPDAERQDHRTCHGVVAGCIREAGRCTDKITRFNKYM